MARGQEQTSVLVLPHKTRRYHELARSQRIVKLTFHHVFLCLCRSTLPVKRGIHNLQDTTTVIKESMQEMSAGAKDMNGTSAALSDISSKVHYSIQKIGKEIDQFRV